MTKKDDLIRRLREEYIKVTMAYSNLKDEKVELEIKLVVHEAMSEVWMDEKQQLIDLVLDSIKDMESLEDEKMELQSELKARCKEIDDLHLAMAQVR